MLADPAKARYVAGWGRAGDFGLVAVAVDGERLGASWYRSFSAAEPGFGFVGEEIPELSVAVRPARRGYGIGTALVAEIVEHARLDGLAGLSLSVEKDNPAVRIYRRLGFSPFHDEGGALVLVLRFIPESGAT